ncbi:MAG: tRNA pseudouridine(38-40) synthase TruA [Rhodospirillales bacterium]
MTRYKLTVEYDGTPFVGWQWQRLGTSVQQVLQEAAQKFCGPAAEIYGAGRTDAGVHALGQCAHLDIDKETTPDVVRDAINFHCKPWPVSVLAAEIVPDDFHARFSATGRRYRYRIINRMAPLTVDLHRAWRVKRPLDDRAMHQAAQLLVGHHDFSGFRSSMCQAKSPLRTLERLDVMRQGEEIVIEADARSFLHNQVRIMVGTLKRLGEGRFSEQRISAALASGKREEAGPTAPPDGLYLTEVIYP